MTTSTVVDAVTDDDLVTVFGRQLRYKYIVAIAYVGALFLDILDTTIVNVAIPTLGREFASDNAEWVVLGYTLSLAVWIPVSGWLGDRFGTKRTFMFAFAAFITASVLCAAAQSMGQLIAFRVVQGVGGGMLTPVGFAMLFRAFPPSERARAATFVMIPSLAAPALGPIIGGLLVTHLDWRWIFLINLPIGVFFFCFAAAFLRDHREPTAGRFDAPGFVLSGTALGLIVYSLSQGPRLGWRSSEVLIAGGVGLVAAVAMVVVELRVAQPMLDLRLLGNRLFRQCNLLSMFAMMSFLGLLFLMPLYLQLFRGLDALESGLTTFPQAIGVMTSTVLAGRLYAAVGPRRLISGGLFAAGAVISLFVFIGEDTNLWLIRLLMLFRGLCMGFAFVPLQAASYATIPPESNGRASSLFSVQRQVGISLGVAVLASVLASFMPLAAPPIDRGRALDGFRLGFGVAVGFAWVAAAAALFIRDSDAAATMRERSAQGRKR